MRGVARLLALAIVAIAATSAQATVGYEIQLDARHPTRVHFLLTVPAEQDLAFSVPKGAEQPSSAPTCASTPLQRTGPTTWLKPKGCAVVSWAGSVSDLDNASFDGSSPNSGWSGRHQLWLLTGALPWLRIKGQPTVPVRIDAQLRGRQFQEISKIPADASFPVAIVVGEPTRRYTADGFVLNVYGEVPSARKFDRLQRSLVSTLAHWRRDLFQKTDRAPDQLNYVWFGPSPNSEPGIFASANSDAILIQYIPDPKSSDPDVKLAAGVFGTGAHEAFHAMGAVSGAPAWANESLAMYFAYAAARRHLSGESLRLFSQLVNGASEKPLLVVEKEVERGDQSDYGDFYSRGARFWAAIDKVLSVAPNGSGKLAALIGKTNGFAGLDWTNADAIAAYFDRYSRGRAGAVVCCYLTDGGCQQANVPL